nr:MAG TPA: hypothetical protein [Caudoviricetes sp.]
MNSATFSFIPNYLKIHAILKFQTKAWCGVVQ